MRRNAALDVHDSYPCISRFVVAKNVLLCRQVVVVITIGC